MISKKKKENYYILVIDKDADKIPGVRTYKAEEVEGYTFYSSANNEYYGYRKVDAGKRNNYYIDDLETGLNITKADTLKEALAKIEDEYLVKRIKEAKEHIKNHHIEYSQMISDAYIEAGRERRKDG